MLQNRDMILRTEHLARCLQTLEKSLEQLDRAPKDTIEHEVFRNAVVKGFELTLETAGKLLRRAVKTYVANPRTVDEMLLPKFLIDARQLEKLPRERFGRAET